MMVLVAIARALERRARTSAALRKEGRRVAAALARRSKEARAFVALTLMKLV